MGCLILKVRATPTRADGECIAALSDRRIAQVHAAHACHLDRWGFNRHGLRSVASPSFDKWSLTTEHTYQRISRNEVHRVNNWTGEYVTFGPVAKYVDGKWQHIRVEEYVGRRLSHKRHRIFGIPGKEVWHGGRSDFSEATLAALWEKITYKTGWTCPHWWPAGRLDYKHHLVWPLSHPLSDAEAQQITGKVVPWRDQLPLNMHGAVDDPRITFNLYRLGMSFPLVAHERREVA